MLVGNAGTGKSVLVADKLGSMDAGKYVVRNVPFNYYTTSAMLQGKEMGMLSIPTSGLHSGFQVVLMIKLQ